MKKLSSQAKEKFIRNAIYFRAIELGGLAMERIEIYKLGAETALRLLCGVSEEEIQQLITEVEVRLQPPAGQILSPDVLKVFFIKDAAYSSKSEECIVKYVPDEAGNRLLIKLDEWKDCKIDLADIQLTIGYE